MWYRLTINCTVYKVVYVLSVLSDGHYWHDELREIVAGSVVLFPKFVNVCATKQIQAGPMTVNVWTLLVSTTIHKVAKS